MHALNENQNSAEILKEKPDFSLSLISETEAMRNGPVAKKSREAAQLPLPELFELHREEVYDFLVQLCGKEDVASELLNKVYRQARVRFASEHYQRYARHWFLRLAALALTEQVAVWKRARPGQAAAELPLDFLSQEEAMVLLLRDRMGFPKREIAKVLEITEGAVETRLLAAREGAAKHILSWPSPNPFSFTPRGQYHSLRTRIALNRAMDGETAVEIEGEEIAAYRRGLERVRTFCEGLESHAAPVVAYEPPAKARRKPARKATNWRALPWHYKLGFECGAFALVGAIAVFVLPAFLAYYDSGDVTMKKSQASQPILKPVVAQAMISEMGDRDPASLSPPGAQYQPVEDEFTYAEFPSGDNHLEGSAPLAPSRKGGAIYRLIIQSENPRELIPKIKSLFAASDVTERDRSGSMMPGGIYFDAVTTEADYAKIFSALSAIAPTKPYQNQKRKGRDDERARVIIWVQQI